MTYLRNLYIENTNEIEVTKMMVLILICIGFLYMVKVWKSYRFFSSRGIKTPKYEFFFGNFRYLRKNNLYSNVLREWTEKFGKTFGYYEGHQPILVTSDLELIQEIFIKQSKNFSARKKESISRSDHSPSLNLFTATKSNWKKMRIIMNPTFSSAKLKELNPLILMCVNRLLNLIKEKENKDINISEYFKRFTMDTIWNCVFGYDIDLQNNPNNSYFYNCEKVFRQGLELSALNYLGIYFHEMKEFILETLILLYQLTSRFLNEERVSPYFWLANKIAEIINNQKIDGNKKRNYLQLLLEARSEEIKVSHLNEIVDYNSYNLDKKLNLEEIKNNLILFMLAGYETTSTALTYCAYVLTRYPEEQLKLYEEINYHYGDSSDETNSENISNLTYLDMFVKEVLRYHPIANPVVTRRCTNATNVKGIDIPVDVSIAVDVLSLHFDKEIWGDDANEFNPLRFSRIKQNPLAFMSFGQGPRNCIGMKFALIELKLALIKILKNYEIITAENTPEKLEYMEGFVRSPKQLIRLIFKKRV